MLRYSSSEWNSLLEEKSFLLVGGHHRGGTTLMWEMLKFHPQIGSFGLQHQTGGDYSEGVFLQDVVPTFGIGTEGISVAKNKQSENRGLGIYALAPEEEVHWTEENHADMVTFERRDRLLGFWGYHWDRNQGMNKTYLMEKSPTNAVVSRYLQALFDLGLESEKNRRKSGTRSKFLFLIRHPLANSYAHKAGFTSCARLGMDKLVGNWVKIMEYIHGDSRKKLLHQFKIVRLEDLTANPEKVFREVLKYLDLEASQEVVREAVSIVKPDQNAKYELQFCQDLYRNGYTLGKSMFDQLEDQFGKLVRQYGYDLREYLDKCPKPGRKATEEL